MRLREWRNAHATPWLHIYTPAWAESVADSESDSGSVSGSVSGSDSGSVSESDSEAEKETNSAPLEIHYGTRVCEGQKS